MGGRIWWVFSCSFFFLLGSPTMHGCMGGMLAYMHACKYSTMYRDACVCRQSGLAVPFENLPSQTRLSLSHAQ